MNQNLGIGPMGPKKWTRPGLKYKKYYTQIKGNIEEITTIEKNVEKVSPLKGSVMNII